MLDNDIKKITEEMLILVAEAIAGMIKRPKKDKILPFTLDKKVPRVIAEAIKKYTKKN